MKKLKGRKKRKMSVKKEGRKARGAQASKPILTGPSESRGESRCGEAHKGSHIGTRNLSKRAHGDESTLDTA